MKVLAFKSMLARFKSKQKLGTWTKRLRHFFRRFGYPEAYYNPPMEAVETIELVRGGASLQFGPQFGGMLNYVRETKRNLL
jgi:outer membrane receptor protein involved in Fe transport